MTKPVRLQLSRRKGFDLQALSLATNGLPAVKVARPTKWGNPYRVGNGLSDAASAALYRSAIDHGLAKVADIDPADLRGKNLACWCALPAPGEPDVCHATVLLELANNADR